MNHFSIAASNAGNSTNSRSFIEAQKKSIDRGRREKAKTTVEQLPSLKASQLMMADGQAIGHSKFRERRTTLGANSDQKDSVGMPLPQMSEAYSTL